MFVGDGVDAVSFLFKLLLQYISGTFSDNMIRSINAIRCMIINFGDNTWNLLAALYWFINSISEIGWFNTTLSDLYEHICTC